MTGPQPYPVRILTLFPDMIRQAASHSIIGRAMAAGLLDVDAIDIRDFTTDRHRTADDVPFGGGPGMVMKPEPVAGAITAAREALPGALVILMSASGKLFDQKTAERYSRHPGGMILVCGHYEGVDERISQHFCDEEICVGDYVLSGGELPALTVMDATARLVPGVLGNMDSLQNESHNDSMLEYPHYTRPREFMGHEVPEVLFSGNHAQIAKFRHEQAMRKTEKNRPDLLIETVDITASIADDGPDTGTDVDNRDGGEPDTGIPRGWGRPEK